MSKIGGPGGPPPPPPEFFEFDKSEKVTTGQTEKSGMEPAGGQLNQPGNVADRTAASETSGVSRQSDAMTKGALQKARLMEQAAGKTGPGLAGNIRAHVDNYGTLTADIGQDLSQLRLLLPDTSPLESFQSEISAADKTFEGIARLTGLSEPDPKEMAVFVRSLGRHLGRMQDLHSRLALAEGIASPPERLDSESLGETIREVESMQESVRNKRQMASTAFENFDQKANQLYNLLSSVMKAMNEMRMGTVRNML